MQFKKGPVYQGPFYFYSFRGRIFPLNYYDADSLRTKEIVQVGRARLIEVTLTSATVSLGVKREKPRHFCENFFSLN